jgi:broad specificity phosphatase PhoE
MKRLYLIRHGEAEGSAGRAVGHLDLPLSAAGRGQIELLAASWKGPVPDRFFASDLRRAVDSAQILVARIGGAPCLDSRLRELSFGGWEGLRWDEIHRRERGLLASWGERWWEIAPPGGETFADLTRRMLAWFHELPEGQVIMTVSHGGSLRALLAALLDLSPREAFDLPLDCARVSAVAVDGASCRLLYLNERRFQAKENTRRITPAR